MIKLAEAVMESEPANCPMVWDVPAYGGTVIVGNPDAPARCHRCGWSGVPTMLSGWTARLFSFEGPRVVLPEAKQRGSILSTWCPVCSCDEAQIMAELDYEAAMALKARQAQAHRPRQVAKVARNAPCPCGSGRKAKKCCYAG